MTQIDLNGDDPLLSWYNRHKEDYEAVRERLSKTRTRLETTDLDTAARMVEKSCVNAVLSIQTDKDRHERAFTAHYAGDKTLAEAARMTVYGETKATRLTRMRDEFNFTVVASKLRDGDVTKAHEYLVENYTGLAEIKAAFVLAMLGYDRLMCLDTNVQSVSDVEIPRSFSGSDAYFDVCKNVHESTSLAHIEPFICQWAMYNFSRGEFNAHLPFYREVLDNC